MVFVTQAKLTQTNRDKPRQEKGDTDVRTQDKVWNEVEKRQQVRRPREGEGGYEEHRDPEMGVSEQSEMDVLLKRHRWFRGSLRTKPPPHTHTHNTHKEGRDGDRKSGTEFWRCQRMVGGCPAPPQGLTMDPDNGAAPGTPSLTFVAPAVLQGGVSDDQLGPAALIGLPAPGRWPQGLPILGPAHRVV